MSSANGYLTFETKNLLVPAFGNTRCLQVNFPFNQSNTIDFKQIVIEDVPFIPQSVTIDATDVPQGEQVVFVIQQINYKRIIPGGQNVTFNFPSVLNLRATVTASDGISVVRTYFYNYPAFVDFAGSRPVVVAPGSEMDVNIISPSPLPVQISGGEISGDVPPINRSSTIVDITGAVGTGNTTIIGTSGINPMALYGMSIFGVITSDADTRLDFKTSNGTPGNFVSIPLISGRETEINIQYNPTTAIHMSGASTQLVYAATVACNLTGTLSVVTSFTRPPAA